MKPNKTEFLIHLQNVIDDRRQAMPRDSYTTLLFQKGIGKIAQKVGEEAVELILESKDGERDLFLNEAADLLYHFLVLLSAKELRIEDVIEVLEGRHK
ncbi:MAG: phosphoribosyl-ATP diphosphatase [Bacteroidales bacterium]|jgi:phosphoribosyl-ATP pyrophosphohydrolase/phosphoribosyl-AMP cyclohydrolase